MLGVIIEMESKIDVVFTSEHLQYKTESKQLKPKSKKKKNVEMTSKSEQA